MSASKSEGRPWSLRGLRDPSLSQREVLVGELVAKTGLSPLTVRLCIERGLTDGEKVRDFLEPKLSLLTHPFKIRDLRVAAERLVRARELRERVRVYGDYDVDGTTGAALLSWVFREYGFEFDATQPDRFKDGYGLNAGAVEQASRDGIGLLVTVDCGITSFPALERARELGLEVIIVDHHQVDAIKGLPPALSIVNPQRADCESGLRQLCGCGLAFYLSMGLRILARERGWMKPGTEPNLKQHLDLVVMATAADMVPLLGDNHTLVRHGMEVLRHSSKPGVRALLSAAGLGERELSPGHLGFTIGPRINASGRMKNASVALELLTTSDRDRAEQLAQQLELLNQERGEIQNAIWDEVRLRVEQGLQEGKYQHGIVVADPGWHEGVVGIVASRVTETFHRPAAVLAIREGEGESAAPFAKGSVRSFAGKDVLAALRECAHLLLGFGGHKFAAGLSLSTDKIELFTKAWDEALGRVAEDAAQRPLMIEEACRLEDFDLKTLREIEQLGPFGPGNPEPVFAVEARAGRTSVLKGRHLKMTLGAEEVTESGGLRLTAQMEAIWFHGAERLEMESLKESSFWAGVPEINRFRGQSTPTFRVRDRKSKDAARSDLARVGGLQVMVSLMMLMASVLSACSTAQSRTGNAEVENVAEPLRIEQRSAQTPPSGTEPARNADLKCRKDADCVALEAVCYGWVYVNKDSAEKKRLEILRQKKVVRCSLPGAPEAPEAGEILPHAPAEPRCFQGECTSVMDVRLHPRRN